jgi:hypothetical protein
VAKSEKKGDKETADKLADKIADKIADAVKDAIVDAYADGGDDKEPAEKGTAKGAVGPAGDFRPRGDKKPTELQERRTHVINREKGIICSTERRGFATPQGRSPNELVLDAPGGVIPLWAPDTVLRWRFREESFDFFHNPEAAMEGVRVLCSRALRQWGSAAPVTFKFDEGEWDFEIVMNGGNNCNSMGCTLASSFFPGGGQNRLTLFPKMFEESQQEMAETLCHEFGHVFGLRHFFALTDETAFPAVIFGRHNAVSIMNYGAKSSLTDDDKNDLERLYQMAWDGELTHVNGTPIRLVTPFTAQGTSSAVALDPFPSARRPVSNPMFRPGRPARLGAAAITEAARPARLQSRKSWLEDK